ncbi:MAG: hypothetical protein F4098_07170 [Acidimicrobiaceae bacterium]|nr:hypothetical protein [Acidimicrobiaceae bacterium]
MTGIEGRTCIEATAAGMATDCPACGRTPSPTDRGRADGRWWCLSRGGWERAVGAVLDGIEDLLALGYRVSGLSRAGRPGPRGGGLNAPCRTEIGTG